MTMCKNPVFRPFFSGVMLDFLGKKIFNHEEHEEHEEKNLHALHVLHG
jgi:hypothetical protein